MAIENTTNKIFNPAAAVNTISKNTGNTGTPIKQPSENQGAVKVEISPQISSVSRARAAAGDSKLSAETLAAIAAGKAAPQITPVEVSTQDISAAQETAHIQKNEASSTPDAAHIEALANAAKAFANIAPDTSANIGGLTTSSSTTAAPVQTQDTATSALGNTADITV